MKKTDVLRVSAWMIATIIGFTLAACEDEKKPDAVVSGPTGPLTVSSVISDPKVGMPGDTLVITAVVTSTAPNEGDFPVMEWTATGGTFIENNKQTVRWVAPGAAGIYTITAKATNNVNSATGNIALFVGAGTELLSENAGQINLIGAGPDFHYFHSTQLSLGIDVFKYIGTVGSDAIDNGPEPQPYSFGSTAYSADGTLVAWAADTLVFGTATRPRHVYVGDLGAGTYTRVSVDGAKPNNPDRNRFDWPAFSPNKQVVAYQRFAQAWDNATGSDSFLVYIQDLVANKRTLVTYEYASPRAFFPTFSTDGNWLVYVLDPQKNAQWELYGSPMTGNDVDGSIASLVKITDTGGQVISGAPSPTKLPPLMAWNPVSSVLAIAAGDEVLYLVETTATSANVIGGVGIEAREIIWSPNGTMLATTYSPDGILSWIATYTPALDFTVRVKAPAGDLIRDVAFSPDENWLAYRVTRGSGSWFYAVDIGAGTLGAPIPVTSVDPSGAAALYRAKMTLRPLWTNANVLIYPSFNDNGSNTPGVYTRDLSGLLN